MRGRKRLNLDEEDRKHRRTLQNRINKRNERLRKRMKEGINPSLSKIEKDKLYISNLIKYFNSYEFNIHFTGTYHPRTSKKISLQSLKSYTDNFIQLLLNEGIIEYGLFFLDTGENNNNHSHLLLKSKFSNTNIQNDLKSKWLLGKNVDCKVIESDLHKFNVIEYCFKKIIKTNNIDKNHWNLVKI